MNRNLICIVCPKGCNLNVDISESNEILVTGNACKRGADYAVNECTNPVRCVTTTMKTKDGEPVAVKTDCAIPKEKIFEIMEIINSKTLSTPIHIGDIIIENLFGCNVVATQNKE